jgi:hypothetical protein
MFSSTTNFFPPGEMQMRSSLLRGLAASSLVLSVASFASASASTLQIRPGYYGTRPTGPQPGRVTTGDQYSVYSGVGEDSDGQLFLIENTTNPTFDDLVNFDGVPETINPYNTTVPTPRTVTEADVQLDATHRKMSVTVSTTAGNDLWPTGFANGSTNEPLIDGGFGIGFNGVTSIWGSGTDQGLAWNGDQITQADMDIVDPTGSEGGNTGPLPLGTFFNSTTAWDGTFGVIFNDPTFANGVTGQGVTSITLNVTYLASNTPEPASLGLLLPLAGMALRRRRHA